MWITKNEEAVTDGQPLPFVTSPLVKRGIFRAEAWRLEQD